MWELLCQCGCVSVGVDVVCAKFYIWNFIHKNLPKISVGVGVGVGMGVDVGVGLGVGVGVVVGELDIAYFSKLENRAKKGLCGCGSGCGCGLSYHMVPSKKIYLWRHDYHSTQSQPWCPSSSLPPLAPP